MNKLIQPYILTQIWGRMAKRENMTQAEQPDPDQIYFVPISEVRSFASQAAGQGKRVKLVGMPGCPEGGKQELNPPAGYFALKIILPKKER